MKKLFSLTITAMLLSFASFAQLGPITGSTSLCLGGTGYVVDSLHPGGTWSSSNTGVATVDPSVGAVYGVSVGYTILTYTLGGSFITDTFTVNPAAPPAIGGATTVCVGGSTLLTNSVSGGAWSSSNTAIATVDATTGMVYGVSSGYINIFYYAGGSPCPAYISMHVSTATAGSITGPSTVCVSGTGHYIDSLGSTGGTWSVSSPSLATINTSTGVLTGVSAGTVTVSYITSAACGSALATRTVTISSTTVMPVISGGTTVAAGSSVTLTASVTGGTWTSSATSIATVGLTSGVVTGVAPGLDYISYNYMGCGGLGFAIDTFTVTAIDGISGNVNFTGAHYYGPVKVWLITYNASTLDLEALDSSVVYSSGTSAYYQFIGIPTDSYRVKAAAQDSLGSGTTTTGYVPTYHTSSFYWNTADVIPHTSGTADANKDINMMSGTVTTGPGFIAGNVTTGANKGTAGGVPVVGLSMNVLNSATSQLMQSVRTDAAGHYSFSNLPVGATYIVFPDSLNYMTTAFTGIALTTAAPSMSAGDFVQHTLSMTITPNTVGVNNVNNVTSSVFAFPNPANSKLNLQWNETTTENGNVTITDIAGREVFKTTINMTRGTGAKQIDLSAFTNGLYLITVKSGNVNYNTKIQVQH